MHKLVFSLCLLFSVLFIPTGCRSHLRKISAEPVRVLRYDLALMQADTAELKTEMQRLSSEFPLYLEGADWENSLNLLRIRNFIEDPLVKEISGRIAVQYADSAALNHRLATLFERTRTIFPDFENPTVYTYISYLDFMNRILYMDSVLSLALDLYVDGNEKQMDEIGIPRYISRKLNAAYLESDLTRVLVSALLPKTEKASLLDHIVFEGKVLYFMTQILPKTDLQVLLGYDETQMLWCKTHEKEAWQYIVQQNLLFETHPLKFRYFVEEGPFNPLLDGAPARLSQYIGLHMVQAFIKKTNNNRQQLLQASPREVLRISAYKP